jgi:hypothetical protein
MAVETELDVSAGEEGWWRRFCSPDRGLVCGDKEGSRGVKGLTAEEVA